MSIVIEHDKRKEEILDKALDIFIDEGFDNVTYQKIADRCGITRTTLYLYFHDKREIFLCSIRQLTSGIEKRLKGIFREEGLSSSEKLRRTLYQIIESCAEHRKLFAILQPYLSGLQNAGIDPNERVRRRFLRVRHILSRIVIEGQSRGEFRALKVHEVNEMLYGLIESAVFRLAIFRQERVDEMRSVIDTAITCLQRETKE
jgi:AcrR family transcriptional regulator